MKFSIDQHVLEKSVKKLVVDLVEENPISEQYQDLWGIIEELSVEDFTSLKKNVYFADFLRSFSCSVSIGSNSHQVNVGDEKIVGLECQGGAMIVEQPSKGTVMDHLIVEGLDVSTKNNVSEVTASDFPSLHTLLDDVKLPERFLKLITRLRNISQEKSSFELGDTLGCLVNVSDEIFSKLPGIGKSYQDVFGELKALYPNAELSRQTSKSIDLDAVDFNNMLLNYAGIDKVYIKALDKLARYMEIDDFSENIEIILQLDKRKLSSFPGFGKTVINKLLLLKNMLKEEVHQILLGEIDYESFESQLIAPKFIEELTVERFGELLLEDIDAFLDKINERESDVIQKRWGFVEDKKTLEEIGEEYDVTRERIRQIEKDVNERLYRNIRFTRDYIWSVLEPALTPELPRQFESLYSCFNDEKDFYEVLGVISDQEDLQEYVSPIIKPNVLNGYFSAHGGPVRYEQIKEYLEECNINGVKDIDNAILFLETQGRIRIDGDNIWPKQLSKSEASAFVLASHPNGLPWVDVAEHVNANKYSRTDIYTDRLDHEAYKLPEYIFLAGKGIYKHTRFIDFDLLSPDEIFDELLTFIDETNREVFHLNECYQSSLILKKQNYYVIRTIVKHYGEEYGFFFNGRSQADSVGLEKGFKNITQRDVIVEAMKASVKPLTNTQVANLLKSKSSNHASYYLDQMIKSEQVVQVDHMLYTVPELAYKNIDIPLFIKEISRILIEDDKPVEPSVFESILNVRLSASYSKFFYSSIARKYYRDQGWYRMQSLYSIKPIKYKNLNEAVNEICSLEHSNDKNITNLLQYISITRKTASSAISNWRSVQSQ